MASGSLLDGLRFARFLADEDAAGPGFSSTEGRFGVPRFNGDPTRLAEWTFRVKALERKEAGMSDTEQKKSTAPLDRVLQRPRLEGGPITRHNEAREGRDWCHLPDRHLDGGASTSASTASPGTI